MDVYRYSIDQSRLGLPVLKILLHTNTITVPVPKSLNVRLSCFVTLRITALSYWRQQFPAARVLLLHAELHHLSTSTNGRRRYRLDQSTPSLAAIVRRSPTQCRPPRKLPRSSHESSHAPLALYPPRASLFTIILKAAIIARCQLTGKISQQNNTSHTSRPAGKLICWWKLTINNYIPNIFKTACTELIPGTLFYSSHVARSNSHWYWPAGSCWLSNWPPWSANQPIT